MRTRTDEDDLPPTHPASQVSPEVTPGSPDAGSPKLADLPSPVAETPEAEDEQSEGGPKVQRYATANPFKTTATNFPTFLQIVTSPTVQAQMHKAWIQTLLTCTAAGRREQGFWVQWNRRWATYSVTGHGTGAVVGPAVTAAVNLPAKPADAPPVYTVASFHTHTPTAYRPVGRAVGPSGADFAADAADNVAGIVYDYWGDGNGNLPAGRSRFWPARLYKTQDKRV
jgi:hypothetical protein